METKKVFSKLGLALFTMALVTIIMQWFLGEMLFKLAPELTQGPWYTWSLLGLSFYCIGFPIFVLMTRKIPNGPKGEKKEMSFKEIITMFFISMAAVYIFNILGNLINILIGLLKGNPVNNPLLAALDGASIFGTLIFVGILSPIIEEIIFRGIMLDKLRDYGDKTAIWVTALTFALFHGNLSQFFYALVLGLFFAYIATKTNTIKYTVLLHIIINILGSVIMPYLALHENQILVGMAGMAVIVMMVVGIVLYKKTIPTIELVRGQIEIDAGTRARTIYLNIGMILYFIVCLEMFIMAILA